MSLYNTLYSDVLNKFFGGNPNLATRAHNLVLLLSNELSVSSPGTMLDTVASVLHREVEKNTIRGDLLIHNLFGSDKFEQIKNDLQMRRGTLLNLNGQVEVGSVGFNIVPVRKGFIMDILNTQGSTCRVDNVNVTVLGSDILVEGAGQSSSSSIMWEDFYELHKVVFDTIIDRYYNYTRIDTPSALGNAGVSIEERVSTHEVKSAPISYNWVKAMLYYRTNGASFKSDDFGTEELFVHNDNVMYSKFLDNPVDVSKLHFAYFYADHKDLIDALEKSGQYLDDRLSKKFLEVFTNSKQLPYSWESDEMGIEVFAEDGFAKDLVVVTMHTTIKHLCFVINTATNQVWCGSADLPEMLPVLYSILLQMC